MVTIKDKYIALSVIDQISDEYISVNDNNCTLNRPLSESE